jgi:hypothetical protein
MKLKKA